MIEIMLLVFLAEGQEIEYLLCGAPFRTETSLVFCDDLVFKMILTWSY